VSGFSPGKDGKAGDIGFIVDAAGCSQAENKPLEARSSCPIGHNAAMLLRACREPVEGTGASAVLS